MNKLIVGLCVAGAALLAGPVPTAEAADPPLRCSDGDGIVTFPKIGGKEDPWGWQILKADKVYPRNPVVVGQDPEKVGVNIQVEIASVAGTVSYEVPVRKVSCERVGHYVPNRTECVGQDSSYW